MTKSTDKPKWIWIAGACHHEDVYLRARRTFTLDARPAAAQLRITAYTEYVLYVNGKYVGCGPAPSSFEEPLLDVYTEADLPLVRGRNVIAVLAHNPYVGLPRRPRAPGALWAELVTTGPGGKREVLVTDRQWRIAPAEDFSRRAPRVYWTDGFTEVRDTRREPQGWTAAGFSDKKWQVADEVRPEGHDGSPRPEPRNRTAARLTETVVPPAEVASTGRRKLTKGLTAIPFDLATPDPLHGEFYAGTFVHSKARQKARLAFDCDEASAVYVNNRQALKQGYKEDFLLWLGADEQNDYAGIHRGQGRRAEAAVVQLEEGWNSVGVVIYDPVSSFGFAIRMDNPRTGEPLDVEYDPDQKTGEFADWQVVCEQICPCSTGTIPLTPGPNARTFPDPAYQFSWEVQAPSRQAARGAATLLADSKAAGRLELGDSEYALYDFADEVVGYIEVDVEGAAGDILDIAWAEGLGPQGDLPAVRRGMRQADRLILRGGRQTVRLVNRRALRYLELVARTGEGAEGTPLVVYSVGVRATGRLPKDLVIAKSDEVALTGAFSCIATTIRACVQDTLEGSPAREAEQSVASGYFLSQAERLLTGRAELGEAALRAFAADQAGDGFFRAVVPAGTQHVVPDWNLLWVIWLADQVAWTGAPALAADLYPVAERCMDWTASLCDSWRLLENKPDRSPWWLMLDLSPIDKSGVVTAWVALYARALRAAAEVAEFLGKHDEAEHGRAEANAVCGAARQRLWDEARGLFIDARHYEHISKFASTATQYYALYGGLATDAQADRILSQFWQDGAVETADWGPHENPYVKFFALEALLERGQANRALAMIRRYWGAMPRQGLVAVPEVFPLPGGKSAKARAAASDGLLDGPYGGLPPEVLCHAWGVHPAALVAKWILGVQPAAPGFQPVRLVPMPGDVGKLSGRVWTPRGPVEVEFGRNGRGRTIHAALPQNMPYRLDRRHLVADDEVEVTGGRAVE